MVWGFSNNKLTSVEDYSMIFKLHGKRRYNVKKMKDDGAVVVIIQKYICKWLVRRAYLKFLSVTTSIHCCWRKVLAIRKFQRLKQEVNEVNFTPT